MAVTKLVFRDGGGGFVEPGLCGKRTGTYPTGNQQVGPDFAICDPGIPDPGAQTKKDSGGNACVFGEVFGIRISSI